MNGAIETVAYQADVAARNRPCGAHPCMNEFPGMPSRWCSGCLIAALLAVRPADDAVDPHLLARGTPERPRATPSDALSDPRPRSEDAALAPGGRPEEEIVALIEKHARIAVLPAQAHNDAYQPTPYEANALINFRHILRQFAFDLRAASRAWREGVTSGDVIEAAHALHKEITEHYPALPVTHREVRTVIERHVEQALKRPAWREGVEPLLERLENYYDFECTGGPLRNCVEWQRLKAILKSAGRSSIASGEEPRPVTPPRNFSPPHPPQCACETCETLRRFQRR